jgi:endonuclease G
MTSKFSISAGAALELQQALAGQRSMPASLRGRDPAQIARAAGLFWPAPLPSSAMEESVAAFAPTPVHLDAGDEAIVRLYDRPSLLVQNGRIADPESDVWRRRLSIFRSIVEPRLASVGRLNLVNSDDFEWVGTAWMITPTIAITNRHVAKEFAVAAAEGGYKARSGFFTGKSIEARIDFAAESLVARKQEIEVARVLYISPDGDENPDMALLEMKKHPSLPAPLELGDDPKVDDWVGLVGYPARDSRNAADAQARTFGDVFDVKRFAPGQVMEGSDGFAFRHDASTLGGNSGSAVINLASGKVVGLHFGGKFLQANFAVRVSKIKEILQARSVQVSVPAAPHDGEESLLEAPRRSDDPTHPPAYFEGREGYKADFLGQGFEVAWPDMSAWEADLTPLKVPGAVDKHRLDYTHFSVVLIQSRRMALVTAVNIDGKTWQSLNRQAEASVWNLDGRVDRKFQLGDKDAYDHNKLDKGHQVRREDPNWGDDVDVARQANADTFHYTNSCPQHKNLNQKTWAQLENFLLDTAKAKGLKLTVFTGPVFRDDDFPYREIRIPAEFFKVAVLVDESTGKLEATGYLQSQTDYLDDIDEEVLNGGSTYQVPISQLEKLTRLDFGALRGFDPLRGGDESVAFRGHRVRGPEDIKHR